MRKKLLLIVGLSVLLTSLSFGLGFFWWTSYATFDYSLQPIIALQGQNISPSDFLIESGRNSRNIQANFRNHTMNYSNLNPGIHEIPINISLGWRTAASVATLYILAPADYVRIEYAQPPERLTPLDFISNADIIVDVSADVAFDVDFVGEPPRINAIPIGRFPVELELNGMMFTSMLDVAITESPSATMADLTIPAGQAISANQFVEDISHAVEIDSIDFLTEPDIFRSGEQVVNIVIQDIFGNRGNFEAMLTVLPNTVPPVILGVTSPIEVMRGNNILFRQGVSAYDAFGRRLDFAVDSSLVNPNLEGHYTAVYRAEDADGLYAEIEIDVFIVSVDPQWVHERVDEILTGIFRDGMTQVEQARAIFDWVSANIMYAGDIGRESVYEGAFQALQNRRGNCYVFYSISEVMLTRAGIPNMRVSRIPGTRTNHRWNLINPDEQGWHHFDTTPVWREASSLINRFMFTNSQAREYTEILRRFGSQSYYEFDDEFLPEIVE